MFIIYGSRLVVKEVRVIRNEILSQAQMVRPMLDIEGECHVPMAYLQLLYAQVVTNGAQSKVSSSRKT